LQGLNVVLVGVGTVGAEFRDYVAARSAALLRTSYLLTGHRADAEDLLQEALFRLAIAWPRVRDRGALDSYVRRTMVNLRTSRWRRHRPVTVSHMPREGVVDDHANQVGDRDEMWVALAALPPRMRAVLVLRFYEDLSEVEIAAVLGVSTGTVKSQTSRALQKLRSALPERSSTC
jgi:RNA polymerase sigma-70 factor (sigma-E family)